MNGGCGQNNEHRRNIKQSSGAIPCHLDSRRMWPGCDDALCRNKPLAAEARTIGQVSAKLMKFIPSVADHIVGNHMIQSRSPKEKQAKSCGCVDRFGCMCTGKSWYRFSQDKPDFRSPHRRVPDTRRLFGNKMTDHTNNMCSMHGSRSCPTVRRRGWGPHTYDYWNSNTATFAERAYDMTFWKEELTREIENLEEASQTLQDHVCEAERALTDTNQPLDVALQCFDRHRQRKDFDGVHTDEVEETLLEEGKNLCKYREKLSAEIANASAQLRRNCQLVDGMTAQFQSGHVTDPNDPVPVKQINGYSRKFMSNSSYRSTLPEAWSNATKELVTVSYVERDKTINLSIRLQKLMREAANEIWQHANVSTNAFGARIEKINRNQTADSNELDKCEKEIREVDRITTLMKRSIRDKEMSLSKAVARIEERTRHLNTDICSDTMLASMKKDHRDTCSEIKLTEKKLEDNNKLLREMRQRQTALKHRMTSRASDLRVDVEDCLPLRKQLCIETRGEPVVNVLPKLVGGVV